MLWSYDILQHQNVSRFAAPVDTPVVRVWRTVALILQFFAISKTQKLVFVAQLLKPLTHVVYQLTRCAKP